VSSPPPLVVLCLGGAAERWATADSPLAAADTPNLDRLAEEGRVFGASLADDGASAAPLLALLGHDPAEAETSRAAYVAHAAGLEVAPEECVVSADLITLFLGNIEDVEPGPWRPAELTAIFQALEAELPRAGFRLVKGAQSHHLALAPAASVDRDVTPVERALGKAHADLAPAVEQHAYAHRLGREVLDGHEINDVRRDLGLNGADMLWLWGAGGPVHELEPAPDKSSAFGTDPAWRGICAAAGIPVKAPGARAPAGIVKGVTAALKSDRLIFVHTARGTQDALRREAATRAEGIAEIDAKLVGPLAAAVAKKQGRLLVLPETARASEDGAPTADPVPALLWGAGIRALSAHPFTEAGAAEAGEPLAPGHSLLAYVQRL
jgi:2,3-bisphosphoglycerate-independent phosphoglycerate mutase